MLISKRNILLFILGALLFAMVCSGVLYSNTLKSYEDEKVDLKGTYLMNIQNVSDPEYLAVIIPELLEGDENERTGEFQWYDADHKMLKQGTCDLHKRDYVTLMVADEKNGMLVNSNGSYYFIDSSFETYEIRKISDIPNVAIIN
jgi:hypothetical protein